MRGARYPTVNELNQHRDRIIQRSRDLQQTTQPRLTVPLHAIENRLANEISIPQEISPMESLVVRDELNDYNDLLDDLEYWHRHNNNTLWSRQRQLIETFSSQALLYNPNLGNLDVFVILSHRVVVNDQSGLGFNIIRVHRDFFNDPKHWCLCAHEIGAHILKDAQLQPVFTPNLPPGMNNGNYAIAVQIWDGLYPPRRDGWFSEVYGDLWSCRIIGPSYLLGFDDYNMSQCVRLTVGDRKHPPSSLRLTLMKRYLDGQGYPANTLPNHTPLPTLLPTLTIDDIISLKIPFRGPLNEIHHAIYSPILIDEVERIVLLN
ncbi:MAG: hypothetical protein RTU30_15985, partial [Candidatus Thorarchaeota archaeon]